MKKVFLILMLCIFIILGIVGCSTDGNDNKSKKDLKTNELATIVTWR